MELKLEHVLLLLLFVFLFSRCNRLTEGIVSFMGIKFGISEPGDACESPNDCKVGGGFASNMICKTDNTCG